MSACPECLARTALLAALSGDVERRFHGRRPPALLSLDDEALISTVRPAGAVRRPDPARLADAAEAARRDHGIEAICRHDPVYPDRLRQLDDPPAVLHVRGAGAELLRRCGDAPGRAPVVAIVGARRAPDEGRLAAARVAAQLAACGATVLSGMAYGIDAAAHDGALRIAEAGDAPIGDGPLTAAVLAGGIERAHPSGLHALYRRILRHGAILGELPPGTTPRRWTFPARNRLIAALADGVVVVAASQRSGSLITAGFAADLDRPIGVVPGPTMDDRYAGSNRLLRVEGVRPVLDASDVGDLIGATLDQLPDRPPGDDAAVASCGTAAPAVVARLRRGPGTIRDLEDAHRGPPTEVLLAVAELEARGVLRRGLDGRLHLVRPGS